MLDSYGFMIGFFYYNVFIIYNITYYSSMVYALYRVSQNNALRL